MFLNSVCNSSNFTFIIYNPQHFKSRGHNTGQTSSSIGFINNNNNNNNNSTEASDPDSVSL